MCVIVVKPPGVKLKKVIWEECFRMNGQGAGLTYVEDDKLIVDKGYFLFDELYEEIEQREEKEMIVHFRIASAGSVKAENCHPFFVQSHHFKNFSWSVSHNGTLDWRSTKDESDTFCFVNDILGPQLDRDPWFLDWLSGLTFLTRFCGLRNKLAIMRWDTKTKLSKIYIINKSMGTEDMGCWFSNTSYRLPFVYQGGRGMAWQGHGDYESEDERFFAKEGFMSEKDWSRHGYHLDAAGTWIPNKHRIIQVRQTKPLPPGQSVIQQEPNSNVALALSDSSEGKSIEVPRDEDVKKLADEASARIVKEARFNSKLEHLTKKGRKIMRRLANDWAKATLPADMFHKLSLAEHVQEFRDIVRYGGDSVERLNWMDQKLDLWIVDEYITANCNPDFLKELEQELGLEKQLEIEDGTPEHPDDSDLAQSARPDANLGGTVEQFPENQQSHMI